MRYKIIRIASTGIIMFIVISFVLTQTALASSGWYTANGSHNYLVRSDLNPGQVYSLTINNGAWFDGCDFAYWNWQGSDDYDLQHLNATSIYTTTFTATSPYLTVHLESGAWLDVIVEIIVT